MTKEQTIKNYMEKLNISLEEATQLWEDDQEDYIGEEGEEMTAAAKKLNRYESGAKRGTSKKERKVDTKKLEILEEILTDLEDAYGIIVTRENEVNLHFSLDGDDYSLKLTKHRKPKK